MLAIGLPHLYRRSAEQRRKDENMAQSIVSQLYKAARLANKIKVWESGSPMKIANHYKNVVLAKKALKTGVFRAPK